MENNLEKDFEIVVEATLRLMEKFHEHDIESSLIIHTMLSIILDAAITCAPDKMSLIQIFSSTLASATESAAEINIEDREKGSTSVYFEALNNYNKNKTETVH
jgi:hypothetical protein|tara:strand:- start:388 stop:696 length:309 start_codon:yes stop_codon:yes gene_type:complete